MIAERSRQPHRRLALAGLLAAALAGCGMSGGTRPPAGVTRLFGPAPVAHGCAEHRGLPNARCTPGAIRSGVSLAAICSPGYSRSVRPPERYTEALKIAQIHAYNLPGPVHDYEEDHLVPLSIGGAPRDPANLWPQPRYGPHNAQQKDQLETWAARMACSHRMPLVRLQREIAHDWAALYRAAGGPRVLDGYPAGG
jgi:hypothetical protein